MHFCWQNQKLFKILQMWHTVLYFLVNIFAQVHINSVKMWSTVGIYCPESSMLFKNLFFLLSPSCQSLVQNMCKHFTQYTSQCYSMIIVWYISFSFFVDRNNYWFGPFFRELFFFIFFLFPHCTTYQRAGPKGQCTLISMFPRLFVCVCVSKCGRNTSLCFKVFVW